jgi:elongation factor 2
MIRKIFKKWLNAADTIVDMIVNKLPSPKEAQKYRTKFLYEGPMDD